MMNRDFFSLGLYEHRLWGFLFIPFILGKKSGESYYSPDQTVFFNETDPVFRELSHSEKELVKIIDEYSDQKLFKLFSRHKNIKEFHEKVTPETIENFIRPYIEKRLVKILGFIKGTNIKVFLREKSRLNIFNEDFLEVSPSELYPNFFFERSEEGMSYTLILKDNNGNLKLRDRYIDILTQYPAIIRVDRKIHFIHRTDAKKLKPFFSRDHILIPAKTEKQYLKTFVSTIIRDYEVRASGFRIEPADPPRRVTISLERGLRNNAVFLLKFYYGHKMVMANSEEEVFVDFFPEGANYRFEKYLRDYDFENEYHDQLNSLSLHSFDQVNYELKENRDLPFDDQLYSLVEWMNNNSEELAESGFIIEQKTAPKDFYQGRVKLDFSSDLVNDWFDIHAILNLDEFKIPFLKLKRNILDNNREYILPNGKIFILPLEWFSRFRELFEFGKTDKEQIRLHKQHFFILEKAGKGTKNRDYSTLEKLNKPQELPVVSLPKGLAANLRPYQQEGFTWLSYLQQQNLGGCLADDMGLGKTLQTICLLLKSAENYVSQTNSLLSAGQQPDLFSQQDKKRTSLVVVPASLVHNWINEVHRFAPSFSCLAYVGNQRSSFLNKFHKFDLVISSYHTIRQDIETISGFRFHYVILDESQLIKNPSSKLYKAVQFLNSEYRLALTGTPIENSLTDLWAQMNFINNGLLGSLNFFKKEYVVPVEKKNDKTKEDKLKTLINPFILRRKKDEVARDLPEMTEQLIYCTMNDEQRKFYEEEKAGIRNSIFARIDSEGMEKSAMIVLQGLTRLRQISIHPRLVDENFRDSSGKFEEIIRNLDNVISEGHKVLVFSSFVKHLEIIREKLEEDGREYSLLTGESTRREDIVREFQEKPSCRVFLISLKAGGVGLNLTAAGYVFILDPWWNPASEEQAVNRAHRIGQEKNVFVYRFISVDSIEEKIQKLQDRKTRLAENFVKSNNPLKNVSREELENLFE